MTYRAVVKDRYYPTTDHDCSVDGFETPEKAFEYAKKKAKETGFTHVDYWVENEDISPVVDGFSGIT